MSEIETAVLLLGIGMILNPVFVLWAVVRLNRRIRRLEKPGEK